MRCYTVGELAGMPLGTVLVGAADRVVQRVDGGWLAVGSFVSVEHEHIAGDRWQMVYQPTPEPAPAPKPAPTDSGRLLTRQQIRDLYETEVAPNTYLIHHGHPLFCMISHPHQPHTFGYEYLHNGQTQAGQIGCTGEGCEYPPKILPRP